MRWRLSKEKWRGQSRFSIVRWNNETKKPERLPLVKYKLIRDDEVALLELVGRLNKPLDTVAKVELKHAFINGELLADYRRYLDGKIPSQGGAQTTYTYTYEYFLQFFIGHLDLPDPLDWYRVHETRWAEYLLAHPTARSAKTKRDIVNAANRFMKWLHRERPQEVPLLIFEPISRARYAEIEARRELNQTVTERRFIPDGDWARIRKKLPPEIQGPAHLAYHYGLRRSETLALSAQSIRNEYLLIERQATRIGEFGPLKGRRKRKVPHWFGKPALCHQWIHLVGEHPINRHTVTDKWAGLMKEMNLKYSFHDLRHTWITRAIREQEPRDVQLAAGHEDMRTTMKYLKDDRGLGDAIWLPPAA